MFRANGYLLLVFVLIGWVIYQLSVRKKAFRDATNEILFIAFFICIWAVIYYWVRIDFPPSPLIFIFASL